jgi:hypothetical protein
MAAPKQKSISEKAQSGGKPTPKPPPPPISEKVKARFLKLTGYKESDILSANHKSYIFVTNNGGKYQMNRAGKVIKVVMGPMPPRTAAVLKE